MMKLVRNHEKRWEMKQRLYQSAICPEMQNAHNTIIEEEERASRSSIGRATGAHERRPARGIIGNMLLFLVASSLAFVLSPPTGKGQVAQAALWPFNRSLNGPSTAFNRSPAPVGTHSAIQLPSFWPPSLKDHSNNHNHHRQHSGSSKRNARANLQQQQQQSDAMGLSELAVPPAISRQYHYLWNHDQMDPSVMASEANKIIAEAQRQSDLSLMQTVDLSAPSSSPAPSTLLSGRQDQFVSAPSTYNPSFVALPTQTSPASSTPVGSVASASTVGANSPTVALPPGVQQQLTALVLQLGRQQQMSMMMQPRFDAHGAARRLQVFAASPQAPQQPQVYAVQYPLSRYWMAPESPQTLPSAAASTTSQIFASAQQQLKSLPAIMRNPFSAQHHLASSSSNNNNLASSASVRPPPVQANVAGVPVFGPFMVTPSVSPLMQHQHQQHLMSLMTPNASRSSLGAPSGSAPGWKQPGGAESASPSGNKLLTNSFLGRRKTWPIFGHIGGSSGNQSSGRGGLMSAAASQLRPMVASPPADLIDAASSQLAKALANEMQHKVAAAVASAMVAQPQRSDLTSVAASGLLAASSQVDADRQVSSILQQQVSPLAKNPLLLAAADSSPGATAALGLDLYGAAQTPQLVDLRAFLNASAHPPYGSRLRRRHLRNRAGQATTGGLLPTLPSVPPAAPSSYLYNNHQSPVVAAVQQSAPTQPASSLPFGSAGDHANELSLPGAAVESAASATGVGAQQQQVFASTSSVVDAQQQQVIPASSAAAVVVDQSPKVVKPITAHVYVHSSHHHLNQHQQVDERRHQVAASPAVTVSLSPSLIASPSPPSPQAAVAAAPMASSASAAANQQQNPHLFMVLSSPSSSSSSSSPSSSQRGVRSPVSFGPFGLIASELADEEEEDVEEQQTQLRRLKRSLLVDSTWKSVNMSALISASTTAQPQPLKSEGVAKNQVESIGKVAETGATKKQQQQQRAESSGWLAVDSATTQRDSWRPEVLDRNIQDGMDRNAAFLLTRRQAELGSSTGANHKQQVESLTNPNAATTDSAASSVSAQVYREGKFLKIKQISASGSVNNIPQQDLHENRRGITVIPGPPVSLRPTSSATLADHLSRLQQQQQSASSKSADPMQSSVAESARIANYFQNVDSESSKDSPTVGSSPSTLVHQSPQAQQQQQQQDQQQTQSQTPSGQTHNSQPALQTSPPQVSVGFSTSVRTSSPLLSSSGGFSQRLNETTEKKSAVSYIPNELKQQQQQQVQTHQGNGLEIQQGEFSPARQSSGSPSSASSGSSSAQGEQQQVAASSGPHRPQQVKATASSVDISSAATGTRARVTSSASTGLDQSRPQFQPQVQVNQQVGAPTGLPLRQQQLNLLRHTDGNNQFQSAATPMGNLQEALIRNIFQLNSQRAMSSSSPIFASASNLAPPQTISGGRGFPFGGESEKSVTFDQYHSYGGSGGDDSASPQTAPNSQAYIEPQMPPPAAPPAPSSSSSSSVSSGGEFSSSGDSSSPSAGPVGDSEHADHDLLGIGEHNFGTRVLPNGADSTTGDQLGLSGFSASHQKHQFPQSSHQAISNQSFAAYNSFANEALDSPFNSQQLTNHHHNQQQQQQQQLANGDLMTSQQLYSQQIQQALMNAMSNYHANSNRNRVFQESHLQPNQLKTSESMLAMQQQQQNFLNQQQQQQQQFYPIDEQSLASLQSMNPTMTEEQLLSLQLNGQVNPNNINELNGMMMAGSENTHREHDDDQVKPSSGKKQKQHKIVRQPVSHHYHFNNIAGSLDDLENQFPPYNHLELLSNQMENFRGQTMGKNNDINNNYHKRKPVKPQQEQEGEKQEGESESSEDSKPKKMGFLRRFSLKNLFTKWKKNKENSSENTISPSDISTNGNNNYESVPE